MSKWILCFLIFLLAGCAFRSDYYKGQQFLDKGNYDGAISLFQYALKKTPNDPQILTDLGAAYIKKKDYPKAIQCLEQARSANPAYSRAYFYLGVAYENQDDIQKAIQEYNAYCKQSPLTPMGRKLKARIGVLMRKQIDKDIKLAIQQEKSIVVDRIPENTIAVSYFANLTGNPEYDTLGKGLADMIITDLTQVESLKVVERARLQVLIDEMMLSQTAVVDQSTAPQIGRLLGARRTVNGGIALPEAGTFRLDTIATDIATSKTDAKADVTGKLDRFFMMEKELVFKLLDEMKVYLSQEEKDAIQKLPTESFAAFLAYSRGLDYDDKGLYREAAGEYKKAAQIDPKFTRANEKQQIAQTLAETPMTGSLEETVQLEQAVVKEEKEIQASETAAGISTADRLEPITRNSAEGFIPEPGAAPDTGRTPPQVQTTTILNINIEW